MPGPVLFATVRWTPQQGRWVGPAIVAGHAVVEVPLVAALVLGLGRVLARPSFVGAVGVAGGAVLLGMGALMLRAAPELELPKADDPEGPTANLSVARVVGAGAATSVSNPYFVLWWGTVGLGLLSEAAKFALPGLVVFYGGHVLADLAWYGAISESLHRGRWFLSDAAYRWIVGVCAVGLIAFALFFGYRGYGFLTGQMTG
jgi:threonine/homoserine/homoserine lactone efflux protein